MNREELKNTDEILSEEDVKLRRMLKNLESVFAPNDFEFRLKQRIANAPTNNKKPSFVWAYRFVLPVLAIGIMFAAFWILSGNNLTEIDSAQVPSVPQISNLNSLENKVADATPLPTVLAEGNSVNFNESLPEVPKNAVAQINSKPHKSEKDSLFNQDLPIGSKDFGVNNEKPIQPDFVPNSNSQTVKLQENTTSISVRDVLMQIGISVEADNGKLVVKSLTSNGLGKSSGIREGDVVIAIDNQNISPNTSFKNAIEAKTITVLRNNVRQTINLKN